MKLICSFPAYLILTLSTLTLLTPASVAQGNPGQPSQSAPDKLFPEKSRKTAPGFSLTDANGKQIQLSDYRGKVVLLDFWATWCGGCKLEIPWYMEFDKKYSRQGLAVIGVSMDDDGWKAVKPFLARKTDPETGGNTAMKYPVVIGSDQLGKAYGLTSMPMTLLIDRQGKIALSHTGVVNKNDFEAHILQLLN
jgi:cytochrome c biogenesis protein CcmG/thiol:disulfide interchange protein DsbE